MKAQAIAALLLRGLDIVYATFDEEDTARILKRVREILAQTPAGRALLND